MGKALFFIASKGDVKEFFGMGVSEPDQSSACFLWVPKVTWKSFLACVLRGVCSHPAGVRVFRNRTCWCSGVSEPDQSIVFYGFQRWRERVFWHAFCLACPASVRVFRIRTNSGVSEPYPSIVFYCFLWVPKVTWKSFLAWVFRNRTKAVFVFYGFQRWRERVFWHVLASCGRSGVSEPDLLVFGCFGTGPKHCFLWVPKVTRKSFLACVLLGVSC